MTITVHEAKTHLSRYLAAVEEGQKIIIARGKRPIACLVPLHKPPDKPRRPRVGETLDGPFAVDASALAPMTDDELRAFGL